MPGQGRFPSAGRDPRSAPVRLEQTRRRSPERDDASAAAPMGRRAPRSTSFRTESARRRSGGPIPILPGRGISPVRDYLVRMTISVYGLVGGTPPESAVIPANPPVGTPNRAYAVPPLREYDRVSPTPLVSTRGTSW